MEENMEEHMEENIKNENRERVCETLDVVRGEGALLVEPCLLAINETTASPALPATNNPMQEDVFGFGNEIACWVRIWYPHAQLNTSTHTSTCILMMRPFLATVIFDSLPN